MILSQKKTELNVIKSKSNYVKKATIIIYSTIMFIFLLGCNSGQVKEDDARPDFVMNKPDAQKGCEAFTGRAWAECFVQMNKDYEELKNAKPVLEIKKERQEDVIVEHHKLCWFVKSTKKEYKCTTWDEFVYEETFLSKLGKYTIVGILSAIGGALWKAKAAALLLL